MSRHQTLTFTLRFIAVVQFALGAAFLLAPRPAAQLLGLAPAPAWTDWLFAMMAARFLGFGYGMWLAARAPHAHRAWIRAMIAIQSVDWIATIYYLSAGAVTLAQVTTAAFLPVLFVLVLLLAFPQRAPQPGAE
jgi:hypothetical protein